MRQFTRARQSLFSVLLATLVLLGGTAMLTGCNTTAGFGQDVSATGKAVEKGADKVKQGL
jgi:predicted small secreted protein